MRLSVKLANAIVSALQIHAGVVIAGNVGTPCFRGMGQCNILSTEPLTRQQRLVLDTQLNLDTQSLDLYRKHRPNHWQYWLILSPVAQQKKCPGAYKAVFDWSCGARVETLGQIHLAGALIMAIATNKPSRLQRCCSEQGIGRKVMIRLAEGEMRAVNWERRGRVGGCSQVKVEIRTSLVRRPKRSGQLSQRARPTRAREGQSEEGQVCRTRRETI